MRDYIVISPVNNEERYIERTLRSVLAQTVKPKRWIVVDDESSDQTPAIIARYAPNADWVQVLRCKHEGPRKPPAEIMAFNEGLALLKELEGDYIVKLDGDLELPGDYFERLIQRFEQDPKLGIASGVYLEESEGKWSPISMPEYHAAGASKFMRMECFRQIGGFVTARGWDTVDEIKAQTLGWRTRHFEDIQFRHLRREGQAMGQLSTNVMHGETYYLSGGSKTFFLLKVLHRMVSARPYIVAGLALLWGFLRSMLRRDRKLVTREEEQYYSRMLNSRVRAAVAGVFRRQPSARSEAWS